MSTLTPLIFAMNYYHDQINS